MTKDNKKISTSKTNTNNNRTRANNKINNEDDIVENISLLSRLKLKYLISVEKVNIQIIQHYHVGLFCIVISIIQTLSFLICNTMWDTYNDNERINQASKEVPPIWLSIIKLIYTLSTPWMSFYLSYAIALAYVTLMAVILIMTVFIPSPIVLSMFAMLGYLHRHFAYFIIHHTLMKAVFVNVNEDTYYQPFSTIHIQLMVFGILAAMFNFSLAMITNNWYFTTQRGDRLARFHRIESLWIPRCGAIIGIVIHLPYSKLQLQLVVAGISIAIASIRFYWLAIYCLYSDFNIAKLKACGCMLEICASLMIFFSYSFRHLQEEATIDGIGAIIILSLVLCQVASNIIENSWNDSLSKNFEDLKDELEALKHFYAFQSFTVYGIGRTIKVGPRHGRKIFINGIMRRHYESCTDPKCFCKYSEYLASRYEDNDGIYEKTFLHFTKCPNSISNFSRFLLETYLKLFPNSLSIKLHCIQYFLESLELYHKGYMMIQHLNQVKDTLPFYAIIRLHELKSRFHTKVHGETKVVAKQGLDIMNMIIYSELENNFLSKIDKQVTNMQKLWGEYLKNEILLKRIMDLGLEIFENDIQIEKKWELLTDVIKKRVKLPYLIYGIYMTICNNSAIIAEDYIDTYKRILDAHLILEKDPQLTQYTLFDSDNMYFVCSAEIECPGVIYSCSENVLQIVGFHKDDLLGKPISCVIPPIYAKNHERYMLEYIETGKQTVFHATRKIFYVHKDGTIFPCYLHMKPDHHAFHGMVFLGVIKPIRTSSEFILTDEDGQIDSVTSEIRKDFRLGRPLHQIPYDVNISIFNSKFKIINEIFTKLTRHPTLYMPKKVLSNNEIHEPNSLIDATTGKSLVNDFDSEPALYEAFKTGVDILITVPKNIYRMTNVSEKVRRLFSFTAPIKYTYNVKINDHFFRGREIVRVYEMVKIQNHIQHEIADHLLPTHLRPLFDNYFAKKNHMTPKNKSRGEGGYSIEILTSKPGGNGLLNKIVEEDDEDLLTFKRNSKISSNFTKKNIVRSSTQIETDPHKIIRMNKPTESMVLPSENNTRRPLLHTLNEDHRIKNIENDSSEEANLNDFDNRHESPYNFSWKTFEKDIMKKSYDRQKPNNEKNIIKHLDPTMLDLNHQNYSQESCFLSCEVPVDAMNEYCNTNFIDSMNNHSDIFRYIGASSGIQHTNMYEFSLTKDQQNHLNHQDENNFVFTTQDQGGRIDSHDILVGIKPQVTSENSNPTLVFMTNSKEENENFSPSNLYKKESSSHRSLFVNEDEDDSERKKIRHMTFCHLVGNAITQKQLRHHSKHEKDMKYHKKKITQTKFKVKRENGEDAKEERILIKVHGKEKIKLVNGQNNGNAMMQSVGESTTMGYRKVELLIEKAIISPFVSKSVKYLIWAFLIFTFLNIVFSLINYVVEYGQLNSVDAEMNTIHYSNKLMDDIVEINRRTRVYLFLETGYMPITRHNNTGIPDYSTYCLEKLSDAILDLKQSSNSMRQFLYTSIGSSYRDQIINELITVYRCYDNRSIVIKESYELFDAITILISEANNILGTNLDNEIMDINNRDMSFILDNSLNNYLAGLLKSSDIFKEAVIYSLEEVSTIQYIITSIGGLVLTILYVVYGFLHYNLVKEKFKILIVLSTINQQYINIIIARLDLMKDFLVKRKVENMDLVENFIIKKNYIENGFSNNKDNKKKQKMGVLNKKGLKRDFFIGLIKIILVVTIMLWYYIIKSVFFETFQNECENLTTQITKSYSSLYNQGLTISLIYEYITQNNDTTITTTISSDAFTNNSILEKLNESLKVSSDLLGLIKSFQQGDNVNNDIFGLFSEDICYLVKSDLKSVCETYGTGVATRGLLAMSSYVQRVLTSLRDNYLASNKSIAVSKELLNNPDLIQIEIIFYSFMRPTYNALLLKLDSIFKSISEELKLKAMILFISFTVLVVLVWVLILIPLQNTILIENMALKKFLRLIPTNIFVLNKKLGRYLITKSPDYFNLAQVLQFDTF